MQIINTSYQNITSRKDHLYKSNMYFFMPFLLFETYAFCMDTLFYNFHMDSLDILCYCKFVMTKLKYIIPKTIRLYYLCSAFKDVITKPKHLAKVFICTKFKHNNVIMESQIDKLNWTIVKPFHWFLVYITCFTYTITWKSRMEIVHLILFLKMDCSLLWY
jgi:hypothetical protein